VREYKGATLADLAGETRIRGAYLSAIEEMRLEKLPSRPFTIGYIRAYAAALGLNGEAAVERFKRETPPPEAGLRAPVGVGQDSDPRLTMIAIGAALIIGAIVLWNIAQRAISDDAPPPPSAPAAALNPPAASVAGPVTLGAPLPAPVESTTPTPYETPGLAGDAAARAALAQGADPAQIAALKAAANAAAVVAAQPLPQTFIAQGTVHGASTDASNVIVQARKAGALVVRGADGSVYFARQLSAGEAYRVPALKGLALDVSDPAAFQVFVDGQSRGLLPAVQIAVSKLQVQPGD
jgi:cytoskeletal protein RodZ